MPQNHTQKAQNSSGACPQTPLQIPVPHPPTVMLNISPKLKILDRTLLCLHVPLCYIQCTLCIPQYTAVLHTLYIQCTLCIPQYTAVLHTVYPLYTSIHCCATHTVHTVYPLYTSIHCCATYSVPSVYLNTLLCYTHCTYSVPSVYLNTLLCYIQCTLCIPQYTAVLYAVGIVTPTQALLTYFKTLNIPGAVLIFLPGWSSIFALHRHLSGHPVFGEWVLFL